MDASALGYTGPLNHFGEPAFVPCPLWCPTCKKEKNMLADNYLHVTRDSGIAPVPAHPQEDAPIDTDAVANLIGEECEALRDMLLEKNAAYGNSALDPVRIFSKANPVEQLLVRLDDKLSRLARGTAGGEDVERDILGYLILLRIARRLGPAGGADDASF